MKINSSEKKMLIEIVISTFKNRKMTNFPSMESYDFDLSLNSLIIID